MRISKFYWRALQVLPLAKSWLYRCCNRIHFKLIGVKFGKRMKVYDRVFIKGKGNISIGDDFEFTSGSNLNPICRNMRGTLYVPKKDSRINIGNNVSISSACIWAKESITIGNHVSVGGDCLIMDCDVHSTDFMSRRQEVMPGNHVDDSLSAPVVIEDDVWIGARCMILKGVHIGARSVIAAGSIVTKDIPADVVAGGNPCKVIKG